MRQAQLIYILGDVHSEYARLNSFINSKIRQNRSLRALAAEYDEFEVVILQCGDFGYWPHTEAAHSYFEPGDIIGDGKRYAVQTEVPYLKNGRASIYWCAGNHENHDALDALKALHPQRPFIPVMPGVFFARFGAVLSLLDGTKVLFCGGAQSTDRIFRIAGHQWWPQEEIDEADMASLPNPAKTPVDWVISHTSPTAFTLTGPRVFLPKNSDPSRNFLEKIRQSFRPKRWWHGHYHLHQRGICQGCKWVCLDCLGNLGRCYEQLLITREA